MRSMMIDYQAEPHSFGRVLRGLDKVIDPDDIAVVIVKGKDSPRALDHLYADCRGLRKIVDDGTQTPDFVAVLDDGSAAVNERVDLQEFFGNEVIRAPLPAIERHFIDPLS